MAEQRRVALVTGANRGIGREIARQLAERGLQVILTARDAAAAEATATALRTDQRQILAYQLDVTDQGSVDRLAADLQGVEVLVNNAGAYYDTDEEASTADLHIVQAALEVHLLGPWRLCKAFIPHMREVGYGRILNHSPV